MSLYLQIKYLNLMSTRKGYKPKNKQSKVQAIHVLKPPNDVTKFKALPWNNSLTWERSIAKCWPLSQSRKCGDMSIRQTAFDNVKGPSQKEFPVHPDFMMPL